MTHAVRLLAFMGAIFGWGCMVGMGCDPPKAPDYALEAAYGAALLRCVDQATTLAESKACRQRINIEWRITDKEAGR